MSLVSLMKIKEDNLERAIEDSLNLIDYRFPSNLHSVVIKPNMCYYWDYSTGQTTNPKFVEALIKVIRKASNDSSISIVEADASAMKCKHVFKLLGYEKLALNYNVNLVNLSEDQCNTVEVVADGQNFHLKVPQIIQKADLKIDVTKIKYSLANIKVTCALKNIFGCNPYPKKYRYHPWLSETIVALNKAMKFDLHLIDGIIVSGIQPRRLGLIMASKDPVAIDVAAAKIAGENPNKIKYIQLAKKEGIGNTSFTPKGTPLNYFKERYPKKTIQKKLVGKAYNLAIQMRLGKRLGIE